MEKYALKSYKLWNILFRMIALMFMQDKLSQKVR